MSCMGAGQLDLGDPSAASGVDVRRGRVLLASSTVANEEAPGCVDKTLPGRSTQHGRSARLTHSTRRHADMNGQPMPACGDNRDRMPIGVRRLGPSRLDERDGDENEHEASRPTPG
jgi:hypothetical protein